MKEAKKTQITEQICKQAQLMRKGGANQTEIGKLLGVNPCTISRIEAAGFDLARYQEMQRERREKEKKQAEEPEPQPTEKQVPGQMKMDFFISDEKEPAIIDQVKLMRFQAGQVDKLYMKMETINDTLNQILRMLRKD